MLFCVFGVIGKSPKFRGFWIFLDNIGGGGYSMFTFRVNKERKNTEICTVDGFIITGHAW